jgi:demethylmenaquinone methyltransferase/2-methoxy-6-polyprenyl-1,4-benzoquinol methylase
VRGWQPRRLLDLATGSGDVAFTLRRACPEAEIVGADFCLPMLEEARAKAARLSAQNGAGPLAHEASAGSLEFVEADDLALPFAEGSIDVVTVAFGLRNMASWPGALREIRRVLRPGGHVLALDFSMPPPPLRWVYRPYLHRVLPWIAGRLTGERGAYEYLGASIEAFPAGEAMRALLREAGFEAPTAERLTGGIVSLYSGKKG